MPTHHAGDNYAVRTLKERREYLQLRTRPGRPNTEQHIAEITAALKILETKDVR